MVLLVLILFFSSPKTHYSLGDSVRLVCSQCLTNCLALSNGISFRSLHNEVVRCYKTPLLNKLQHRNGYRSPVKIETSHLLAFSDDTSNPIGRKSPTLLLVREAIFVNSHHSSYFIFSRLTVQPARSLVDLVKTCPLAFSPSCMLSSRLT